MYIYYWATATAYIYGLYTYNKLPASTIALIKCSSRAGIICCVLLSSSASSHSWTIHIASYALFQLMFYCRNMLQNSIIHNARIYNNMMAADADYSIHVLYIIIVYCIFPSVVSIPYIIYIYIHLIINQLLLGYCYCIYDGLYTYITNCQLQQLLINCSA